MSETVSLLRLREGITVVPFDVSALEPRYLVQSPDGGRFQVSARLADVILVLAAEETSEAACARLSAAWNQRVTPEDLREIAARFLQPYGLLVGGSGAQHAAAARGPLLACLSLFSPRAVAPLTRLGQHLFHLPAVCAILIASLAVRCVVYAHAPAAVGRLAADVWWVPLLFLLSILSHELGHVSACRRYGCAHGPVGIGLYAIFPVFYTDVSETWRLSRRQRIVVDAGGIYFQLAFSLLLYALYVLLGWPAALAALLVSDGMMLLALNPIFRFDGYWIFSDLIGVPNLRQRAAETLGFALQKVLSRGRAQRPDLLRLPSVAMALLAVYTVLSNAVLLYFFGVLLLRYAPGMIGRYPQLLVGSWTLLRAGIAQANLALVLTALSQPLTATLLLVMLALMAWRERHWFVRNAKFLVAHGGRAYVHLKDKCVDAPDSSPIQTAEDIGAGRRCCFVAGRRRD